MCDSDAVLFCRCYTGVGMGGAASLLLFYLRCSTPAMFFSPQTPHHCVIMIVSRTPFVRAFAMSSSSVFEPMLALLFLSSEKYSATYTHSSSGFCFLPSFCRFPLVAICSILAIELNGVTMCMPSIHGMFRPFSKLIEPMMRAHSGG